jgi:hypothetical protein
MHVLQFEKNNRVSDWPVAYIRAKFMWEYKEYCIYAGPV